jgi:demethylmenaquinone methyltransferase/2-methoxy-6-polyprenyl-1,4-benzoquinol methylase
MNQVKARFFDAEAATSWAVAPFGAAEQPKIARLLVAAAIRPGAWVLEPGCGTGRLTGILADAVGPAGQVLACDISQKMVEACRARVGGRGNIRVAQAAVEEYAIVPETVDVIVCHQVFPHFDDKPAALAALVRALKPQGRLLVVHFLDAAAVNDRHRQAAEAIRGDLLPTEADMRRLFGDAGLAIDFCIDDQDGYLVRAMRTTGAKH